MSLAWYNMRDIASTTKKQKHLLPNTGARHLGQSPLTLDTSFHHSTLSSLGHSSFLTSGNQLPLPLGTRWLVDNRAHERQRMMSIRTDVGTVIAHPCPLLFASTWKLRSAQSFPHLSCPSQDDKSPKDLNMVHILGSSLCQTSLFQEDDTPASGKTLSAQNSLIVGFLSMSAPLIRLETILCKLYSLRGMFLKLGRK